MEAFLTFTEKWEKRYPAIIKLWDNAWAEFVPFLAFDTDIRTVICTTDEIVNSAGVRIVRRTCPPPVLPTAPRSCGQGGAPGWRNDLDRGEERSTVWRRWAWSTAERRAACWDWKCCRAA